LRAAGCCPFGGTWRPRNPPGRWPRWLGSCTGKARSTDRNHLAASRKQIIEKIPFWGYLRGYLGISGIFIAIKSMH
jgi:hypothetical protein